MDIKLLDKEKAKKALDDGFCILFGEKHRAFFESAGNEILELGRTNGQIWCYNLLLYKVDRLRTFFEMAEEGIFEKEKIYDIVKSLKPFFTDKEIEKLKKE